MIMSHFQLDHTLITYFHMTELLDPLFKMFPNKILCAFLISLPQALLSFIHLHKPYYVSCMGHKLPHYVISSISTLIPKSLLGVIKEGGG